jgi:hypothetical protein
VACIAARTLSVVKSALGKAMFASIATTSIWGLPQVSRMKPTIVRMNTPDSRVRSRVLLWLCRLMGGAGGGPPAICLKIRAFLVQLLKLQHPIERDRKWLEPRRDHGALRLCTPPELGESVRALCEFEQLVVPRLPLGMKGVDAGSGILGKTTRSAWNDRRWETSEIGALR